MELNTRTVPTVNFYLPTSDTTVTGVTYSLNGSTTTSLTPGTAANGAVPVILPYQQSEGEVRLVWSFTIPGGSGGSFTDTQVHTVVTPLLNDAEIKAIHPSATADEIVRIERATRNIISAHTGQSFGYFIGKKKIRGSGSFALSLPSPLLSLTNVDGAVIPGVSLIQDGGWTLYKFHGWPYEFQPNTFEEVDAILQTKGVIFDPTHPVNYTWVDGFEYAIDGHWGYEYVPAPVQEAAKLLVNDYACGDIQYRDRYLTSMTAADWRIQFNSGAFRETGNVRADQLLRDYVLKSGWAVI